MLSRSFESWEAFAGMQRRKRHLLRRAVSMMAAASLRCVLACWGERTRQSSADRARLVYVVRRLSSLRLREVFERYCDVVAQGLRLDVLHQRSIARLKKRALATVLSRWVSQSWAGAIEATRADGEVRLETAAGEISERYLGRVREVEHQAAQDRERLLDEQQRARGWEEQHASTAAEAASLSLQRETAVHMLERAEKQVMYWEAKHQQQETDHAAELAKLVASRDSARDEQKRLERALTAAEGRAAAFGLQLREATASGVRALAAAEEKHAALLETSAAAHAVQLMASHAKFKESLKEAQAAAAKARVDTAEQAAAAYESQLAALRVELASSRAEKHRLLSRSLSETETHTTAAAVMDSELASLRIEAERHKEQQADMYAATSHTAAESLKEVAQLQQRLAEAQRQRPLSVDDLEKWSQWVTKMKATLTKKDATILSLQKELQLEVIQRSPPRPAASSPLRPELSSPLRLMQASSDRETSFGAPACSCRTCSTIMCISWVLQYTLGG